MPDHNPDNGSLFIIVGYADPKILENKAAISKYLKGLTRICQMTPMAKKPAIYLYESEKPEEFGPGITGLIPWAESHAAAHTWPEWKGGRFEIIIHSCKSIDGGAVESWTRGFLEVEKLQITDLSEALNF